MAFLGNTGIRKAMGDPEARKKVAAHLLPALCLALLDPKPEVKVIAIYHLMMLGPDAQSAIGALQDASLDSNESVRQAAGFALKIVEGKEDCPWFMP
jgi:HEAT repeat protein